MSQNKQFGGCGKLPLQMYEDVLMFNCVKMMWLHTYHF